MKRIGIILIVLFTALQAAAQQKQNLKVLYVGGSADWEADKEGAVKRTEAFENYLKTYFTEVKAVNSKEYATAMSAGYDVTVGTVHDFV